MNAIVGGGGQQKGVEVVVMKIEGEEVRDSGMKWEPEGRIL